MYDSFLYLPDGGPDPDTLAGQAFLTMAAQWAYGRKSGWPRLASPGAVAVLSAGPNGWRVSYASRSALPPDAKAVLAAIRNHDGKDVESHDG